MESSLPSVKLLPQQKMVGTLHKTFHQVQNLTQKVPPLFSNESQPFIYETIIQ